MRAVFLQFGLAALLAAGAGGLSGAQEPAEQAPAGQSTGRQLTVDQRLNAVLDRWNKMPPEQRERELAKLPPERARRIRLLLHRYNQMNPQEQEALRQRYRTFSELPQAEKQTVRQRLEEFRQLPRERQITLHAEVDQLRRLPPAQRQARYESAEFRGRYSPQEQQIVKDLTEYLEPGK
ncbi:MAG TPA: DUF3106 domain-containing protein [Bryobacteraceae bacterium]|nr:DUF3106 domain-containing protein [Bryobacteraceae bacterium]